MTALNATFHEAAHALREDPQSEKITVLFQRIARNKCSVASLTSLPMRMSHVL